MNEIKVGENGPSQGGTVQAYEPQYYCPDRRRWLSIPIKLNADHGIPVSCIDTIKTVLGYLPREAALAFAWAHLARARGLMDYQTKVRLVQHEINYDVRSTCKNIEELDHKIE